MSTKTATASFDSARHFFLKYPKYDFFDRPKLISESQKSRLRELIFQNITDENDRELKLMELEEMDSVEADDSLYGFSVGKW